MLIDLRAACAELTGRDNILILAHKKPDGDTLGSSFALLAALESLGKRARVYCADGFPERYSFLCGGYAPDTGFEPGYIVAVDVASPSMLGGAAEELYGGKVDLCIDHHKSNTLYAEKTLLDADAPAAAQLMYEIIAELGARITPSMASALFTGLATDTGCFKYSNVRAKTHRAAAELIELGADHVKINKLMFDTKSIGAMMVDRMMIDTVKFYFDNRCALVVIPADVIERFSVSEEELDGISAFSVRIQGVFAGVTIRMKDDDTYRVSLRTVSPVDASKICGLFGGGGHANAAGCTMSGSLDGAISRMLAAIEAELKEKLP